jgi:hypothetical protein
MASFFSTPKARKFHYTPRFYNEREEQRKERFARIEKELEAEKGENNSQKEGYVNFIKFARKERKKSKLRIMLILLALLLLLFLFINLNQVPFFRQF